MDLQPKGNAFRPPGSEQPRYLPTMEIAFFISGKGWFYRLVQTFAQHRIASKRQTHIVHKQSVWLQSEGQLFVHVHPCGEGFLK